MNKKYMTFGLISLFAMALVSAGLISYYGQVETTIEVNQPIEVNGMVENSILDNVLCNAGEICNGAKILVSNNGDTERTLLISNNAVEGEVDVDYIGTLQLTSKNTAT